MSIAITKSNDVILSIEKDSVRYLSDAETVTFMNLKSIHKKYTWLTGRLLSKYLFLKTIGSNLVNKEKQNLLKVTLTDIHKFPVWIYQKIEILTPKNVKTKKPSLYWCKNHTAMFVSISHSEPYTASCISLSNTSIDLESILPRNKSFYLYNYTGNEKKWIHDYAVNSGISKDWLLSFLWTIKEGIIKSGYFPKLTLWNIPKIEVIMPSCIHQNKNSDISSINNNPFLFRDLATIIKVKNQDFPIKIKYIQYTNLILTSTIIQTQNNGNLINQN